MIVATVKIVPEAGPRGDIFRQFPIRVRILLYQHHVVCSPQREPLRRKIERFNCPFVGFIDSSFPIFGERHLPGCQVSVVQSQDPAGDSILPFGDVLCDGKPYLPGL